MERLKPMDAQFIDAEDQDKHASFAIASIAVFEGPAPLYEEFRPRSKPACRRSRSTAGSCAPCHSALGRRSG